MKFLFIVAASVCIAFPISDGELPLAKMCSLRKKTRDKYVCRGQMISINAEMARVANVERGNFVCEYNWHILRTTNNIRPYPLPSHPRAKNPTLIPAKLFQVFDEVRKACRSIEPEYGGATSYRQSWFSERESNPSPRMQLRGGRNRIGGGRNGPSKVGRREK